MNKKILDAVLAAAFCVCLIGTSNIQESSAESLQTIAEAYRPENRITDDNGSVSAGICLVLSKHSFTTESDEKTVIERNQSFLVAAPENSIPEENEAAEIDGTSMEEDACSEEEASEQAVVTAGLAQAAGPEDETAPTAAVQTQPEEAHLYVNRWNINLTEDEIDLLARIVWLEANGEPVEGQEAVVEVVFNRMTSDLYPNILYDVLSQRNPVQFCSWKNREIAKPTEKEYQSIYEVLNGNTSILRNDTMYFSTHALTSNIDKKIGGHSFCY